MLPAALKSSLAAASDCAGSGTIIQTDVEMANSRVK